ncbi:hypothetical protein T439DRAFT_381556 [Meredithblackwellia eburnea MCA 4105]
MNNPRICRHCHLPTEDCQGAGQCHSPIDKAYFSDETRIKELKAKHPELKTIIREDRMTMLLKIKDQLDFKAAHFQEVFPDLGVFYCVNKECAAVLSRSTSGGWFTPLQGAIHEITEGEQHQMEVTRYAGYAVKLSRHLGAIPIARNATFKLPLFECPFCPEICQRNGRPYQPVSYSADELARHVVLHAKEREVDLDLDGPISFSPPPASPAVKRTPHLYSGHSDFGQVSAPPQEAPRRTHEPVHSHPTPKSPLPGTLLSAESTRQGHSRPLPPLAPRPQAPPEPPNCHPRVNIPLPRTILPKSSNHGESSSTSESGSRPLPPLAPRPQASPEPPNRHPRGNIPLPRTILPKSSNHRESSSTSEGGSRPLPPLAPRPQAPPEPPNRHPSVNHDASGGPLEVVDPQSGSYPHYESRKDSFVPESFFSHRDPTEADVHRPVLSSTKGMGSSINGDWPEYLVNGDIRMNLSPENGEHEWVQFLTSQARGFNHIFPTGEIFDCTKGCTLGAVSGLWFSPAEAASHFLQRGGEGHEIFIPSLVSGSLQHLGKILENCGGFNSFLACQAPECIQKDTNVFTPSEFENHSVCHFKLEFHYPRYQVVRPLSCELCHVGPFSWDQLQDHWYSHHHTP